MSSQRGYTLLIAALLCVGAAPLAPAQSTPAQPTIGDLTKRKVEVH